MKCYICYLNVSNWKALVTHFKIFNLLKSDSAYKCCEGNCTQSFLCLGSFKRHMLSKHAPKPDLLNYDEQLNCKSPQSPQNCDYIDNIVMQSDNDDSIPIDEVQFNTDLAIKIYINLL